MYHTKSEGIVYNPDTTKGLECYVDTDFAGGWQQADSDNADNILSRTGMVIMYANCPIFWRITLQTQIALSTAEVEYIALSSALRLNNMQRIFQPKEWSNQESNIQKEETS